MLLPVLSHHYLATHHVSVEKYHSYGVYVEHMFHDSVYSAEAIEDMLLHYKMFLNVFMMLKHYVEESPLLHWQDVLERLYMLRCITSSRAMQHMDGTILCDLDTLILGSFSHVTYQSWYGGSVRVKLPFITMISRIGMLEYYMLVYIGWLWDVADVVSYLHLSKEQYIVDADIYLKISQHMTHIMSRMRAIKSIMDWFAYIFPASVIAQYSQVIEQVLSKKIPWITAIVPSVALVPVEDMLGWKGVIGEHTFSSSYWDIYIDKISCVDDNMRHVYMIVHDMTQRQSLSGVDTIALRQCLDHVRVDIRCALKQWLLAFVLHITRAWVMENLAQVDAAMELREKLEGVLAFLTSCGIDTHDLATVRQEWQILSQHASCLWAYQLYIVDTVIHAPNTEIAEVCGLLCKYGWLYTQSMTVSYTGGL